MKEVVLYDFTKDWKDFFRGDKNSVFEHIKRQSIGDEHSIFSKLELLPLRTVLLWLREDQGAARR